MAEYTTKLQDHKKESVAVLKELFSSSKDYIFADYRGLNVEQITELRRKLREKGAELKVVKNRYAKIALEELNVPDVTELLIGPTAMTLAKSDSGPVAKILFQFAEDAPVEVKGAVIDGTVFDRVQVEELSKLPGREELLAKLMSVMNGPVRNLMYAMLAVPQKLVRTLQAVADAKQNEGEQ